MISNKWILWALAAAFLLALPLACSGEEPTDREMEIKVEAVGEKLGAAGLLYALGSPGECGDVLDKYEDDINQAAEEIDVYDGDSKRELMSLLEDLDQKLDDLEEELEDEDCI